MVGSDLFLHTQLLLKVEVSSRRSQYSRLWHDLCPKSRTILSYFFFMTHADQPTGLFLFSWYLCFRVFLALPSLTLGLVRGPASGFREKLDYQLFPPRRISGCFLQIDFLASESSASWGGGGGGGSSGFATSNKNPAVPFPQSWPDNVHN